jgi:hypothetical protein
MKAIRPGFGDAHQEQQNLLFDPIGERRFRPPSHEDYDGKTYANDHISIRCGPARCGFLG